MYKPPVAREPVICFANVKQEKATAYTAPGSRNKTFSELFPELDQGTVTLKIGKKEPTEVSTAKSFAARIQEKLDKERDDEMRKAALKRQEEDEDGPMGPYPKVGKYLQAVEATNLRKKLEYEQKNKIFDFTSDEEEPIPEEEEFDEFYDDEEETLADETYDYEND